MNDPLSADPRLESSWLLPRGKLNHIQQRSIERLVELCAQAHYVDVKVRINGEDKWFQVDWIKHLEPFA